MHGILSYSRSAVCGLLAALLLSGCATSQYGEQITKVNYYPQCYAPINDLRTADKDFNKTVVASSAVGVISGALIGLLVTGKAEGAAVGALAGGVAGAGIGYAKAKQDRIADDNRRMASYLVDINGDIAGIDRATAAARVARDCYDKEFQRAIAEYKAGRVSREGLSSRYTEIKDGCTEAAAILGSTIAATTDKERDYQSAIQDEAQRAGRPAPVIRPAYQSVPAESPAATTASASSASKQAKPAQSKAAQSSAAPSASATTSTPSTSAAQQKAPAPAKITKTAAPRQGDHSLDAVAQNAQRLNEAKQSATDEREALLKMQEEMDSTLATVLS